MMMDTPPIKKRRQRQSNRSSAPYPTLFLPDELIAEILSVLNVKNIVQLKCLSKSWNTLISDPTFVEKHLKKSSQNPHLLFRNQLKGIKILPFPVHCLLKNPSINVYSHNFHCLKKNCTIVGSCNGLLCLLFDSQTKYWLRIWNPATRTRSKKLGLCYSTPSDDSVFTFGYVASTRTYKVVAIRGEKNGASWKSVVKVFSVGNNCWRNIQSFDTVPVNWFDFYYRCIQPNDGVHLNGTVNWLTHKSIIHPKQFLIVSLDLSTETYKQFQLPNGVPFRPQPVLSVFMDSLCFSLDSNKTELVLWQMKEYGVQESWTQLFKISYQNLERQNVNINPTSHLEFLYVNGDMVIFANEFRNLAYIYNLKDKTVEKIKTRNSIHFGEAMDYVESLVSVH